MGFEVAAEVGDCAARGDVADRAVALEGDVVEADAGPVVEQAAAQCGAGGERCQSVGDGELADAQVRVCAADGKDARGVAAADCEFVFASAVDRQIVSDIELAGEADGAFESAGKLDDVRAWGGVGGVNRGPQRAGAVVEKVRHGEGTEHEAVFEPLAQAEWRRGAGAADAAQCSPVQRFVELRTCHVASPQRFLPPQTEIAGIGLIPDVARRRILAQERFNCGTARNVG
jgi:hypothetical protein